MKEIERNLMNTLFKFQEGYHKRDINQIDDFISELFIDPEEVVVIGTAYNEWCKGREQLKEFLNIDWFYWGKFAIRY